MTATATAVPHTFEVTSVQARFLIAGPPAGLENFLRAAAAAPPSPDPTEYVSLAAEHGMDVLGSP